MPSSVDPKIFKDMYLAILKNKESDLTVFLSYIDEFISKVYLSIINKDESYYFYLFLKKNICSFTTEGSIDKWIETKEVKEDILFILIERLRKLKTHPTKATPIMCQFYFVTDFRLAISTFIKKNFRIKNIKNTLIKTNQAYLMEKRYNLPNPWYNYLVQMLIMGYNITEISKLTGFSRTTIHKELKKICL